MADIFISYARADRPRVGQLAAALETAGYTVWWDHRIEAGSAFSADIERELNEAGVVLVCWSVQANQSDWVKDEAAAAMEQGKLIPVQLDGERPPMGFRQYQAQDLSGWTGRGNSPEFDRLLNTIAARLDGETVVDVPGASISPGSARRHHWMSLRVLALLALMLVTALGSVFWFGISGDGADAPQGLHSPPRIAVTPVSVAGDASGLAALAEPLRDDIASGLARFSMLAVASPGNADQARYRLDSTLQQTGDSVRVSARLIDNDDGRQVWGERYDRDLNGASMLSIQDDLTDHIVASVADPYGALMRDLQAPVSRKSPADLTPYEAVVRHAIYRQRLDPDDHRITRDLLERVAEAAPDNSDVFATLAAVTIEEIKHDYNRKPDAGARALAAARRAVELDPDNAYAWFELAEVQFFLRNTGAFRSAAERAMALNPRDTEAMAMLGILMGYSGDWERGYEWTARAMQLNPNHPGWYRFNHFFDAYRQGKYEQALDIALRINQPGYFADPYARAMAHGQLGNREAAEQAAQEFVSLLPEGLETWREKHSDVWMYAVPDLQKQIVDGLRKAGLKIDRGTDRNAGSVAGDSGPD